VLLLDANPLRCDCRMTWLLDVDLRVSGTCWTIDRHPAVHCLPYPRNSADFRWRLRVTTKYHKRVWSESRDPLFCEISGSRRVWNVLEWRDDPRARQRHGRPARTQRILLTDRRHQDEQRLLPQQYRPTVVTTTSTRRLGSVNVNRFIIAHRPNHKASRSHVWVKNTKYISLSQFFLFLYVFNIFSVIILSVCLVLWMMMMMMIIMMMFQSQLAFANRNVRAGC